MTSRRRKRGPAATAGRWTLLAIAVAWTSFPIYWTLGTALKQRRDAFASPPQLVPTHPTLENFSSVITDGNFVHALLITLVLVVASSLVCLTAGGLAAYALVRFRFAGSQALQAALLALRVLPAVVLIIPVYTFFADTGLVDQLPAIALVYAAINLPFAIWLLTSFFREIPLELEEAARVDGASRLQTVRLVVLPLAVPGLVATGIFCSILAWNEFLVPVVLTNVNAKPLSVYIASFVGARTTDWGRLAAAASLSIVPIVVFAGVVQRYMVSGLTAGAVKQ